jgi:hypothetical protein
MAKDLAPHLMTMLDQVQSYFMTRLVGGIARLPDKPEAWAFVGLRTETAVPQLLAARALFPESPSPKFLDCGSGLAFVTALARGIGFDATGIEWNEQYVSIARQLFSSARTVQGDVLAFAGYGDYDVIYYYGPFSDEEVQRRFEEKVEAEAKVGAVIIGNRKASDAWRASNRFQLLAEDGYMGVLLRKLSL